MNKKRQWIVLMVTLFFLPSVCFAQGTATLETESVLQSEGRAAITKSDTARARDEAVQKALENAVLQTAVGMVPERISEEKLRFMKSMLTGKVGHYIRNYRIAGETMQQEEYVVDVQAAVAITPLRNDLLQMGLLRAPAEKTRVDVSVHMTGVNALSDFNRLKDFLQSRTAIVKSMYPCRLEAAQVQCDLVIWGTPRNLADEFEKTGKYKVDVITKNHDIVINLQRKEEVR